MEARTEPSGEAAVPRDEERQPAPPAEPRQSLSQRRPPLNPIVTQNHRRPSGPEAARLGRRQPRRGCNRVAAARCVRHKDEPR